MSDASATHIAVGVDGGSGSHAALEWASVLSAERQGELTAYTAWNYPTALMMPVVGAPVVPAGIVEDKAKRTLAAAIEGTPNVDPTIGQRVIMGAPRAVLTEASEIHDLLVLGRSGEGRLKRLWLGSTAAYCTRRASCPVAVVRDARSPERRVTVAVDGSSESVRALAWALGLGDSYEVLAVYSYEEWELAGMAGDHKVRSELPPAAVERLATAVAEAAEIAGVDAASVKQEVRRGDARGTIIDDATSDEMLVVGSQGHTALGRWFLGSFTEYALHNAPGTVVVWRSES